MEDPPAFTELCYFPSCVWQTRRQSLSFKPSSTWAITECLAIWEFDSEMVMSNVCKLLMSGLYKKWLPASGQGWPPSQLAGLGLGGTVLWWCWSFWADRFQKVVLGVSPNALWHLVFDAKGIHSLPPHLLSIYMKALIYNGFFVLFFHWKSPVCGWYPVLCTTSCWRGCGIPEHEGMKGNKVKFNLKKTEVIWSGDLCASIELSAYSE